MKNPLALVVGLLLVAMPAKALSFEEASQLVKMDNEQVIARIPEDVAAATVVADLQKGAAVSVERFMSAEIYCSDMLAKIDTKKKRKLVLGQMLVPVKSELEVWAWRGGSDDRYFEARMRLEMISRRLKSLLEFEAERYTNFLSVIHSRK